MTHKKSKIHAGEMEVPYLNERYPNGETGWSEPHAPDIAAGVRTASLGGCDFCGSLHPSDVVKYLQAGATIMWADWKYGYPHKAYLEKIPNPYAGMLESRMGMSNPTEEQIKEHNLILVKTKRFDQYTGNPVYEWINAGEPASKWEYAKFYTMHLQDATPEEKAYIEHALGYTITFEPDGGMSWEKIETGEVH